MMARMRLKREFKYFQLNKFKVSLANLFTCVQLCVCATQSHITKDHMSFYNRISKDLFGTTDFY